MRAQREKVAATGARLAYFRAFRATHHRTPRIQVPDSLTLFVGVVIGLVGLERRRALNQCRPMSSPNSRSHRIYAASPRNRISRSDRSGSACQPVLHLSNEQSAYKECEGDPSLVGTGGIEPPTPAMSRRCSKPLSYVPKIQLRRRFNYPFDSGVSIIWGSIRCEKHDDSQISPDFSSQAHPLCRNRRPKPRLKQETIAQEHAADRTPDPARSAPR